MSQWAFISRVTFRAPSEEQAKELSERLEYEVSADQVEIAVAERWSNFLLLA